MEDQQEGTGTAVAHLGFNSLPTSRKLRKTNIKCKPRSARRLVFLLCAEYATEKHLPRDRSSWDLWRALTNSKSLLGKTQSLKTPCPKLKTPWNWCIKNTSYLPVCMPADRTDSKNKKHGEGGETTGGGRCVIETAHTIHRSSAGAMNEGPEKKTRGWFTSDTQSPTGRPCSFWVTRASW